MRSGDTHKLPRLVSCSLILLILFCSVDAFAWWNGEWKSRRKIGFDASSAGADINENLGEIPVLVRLHTGNFIFGNAKANGEDIRFIGSDDQAVLKYHIEKYDTIDEMALIWVKLPKISSGSNQDFIWMYYGNEAAVSGQGAKETYDGLQIGVYHFGEAEGAPQDSSMNANHAATFLGGQGLPGVSGNCVVFSGGTDKMIINHSPSVNYTNGWTFSAWVRINAEQQGAYLYLQQEGDKRIAISIDGTRLFAEMAAAKEVSAVTNKDAELSPGVWHQVTVTAVPNDRMAVFIDGAEVSGTKLTGAIPEIKTAVSIGNSPEGSHAFSGELDELSLAGTARSAGWVRASYASQGNDGRLFSYSEEETGGGSAGGAPILYLGPIIKNITLDGWVIIGCLAIMGVGCLFTFFTKAFTFYLMEKENKVFLNAYIEEPSLTALSEAMDRFPNSNLFSVYSEGCRKLAGYVGKANSVQAENEMTGDSENTGMTVKLSQRTINAVKSILEKGFIEQSKRLNAWMVVMTLSISGGPFLGLLGTVWGVMSTFAALAETGEANLAAIAPGIASALTTTVAGLLVAIPALFSYNYLVGKIKNITMDLTVFVDQFSVRVDEMHGE
ncbi:MAG: DUF2341 domain-containing protein [Pseudomonadota bacterium]